MPLLFANKQAEDMVKIWSPGCATGEEAYSVAIYLLEKISALNAPLRIRVFATDVDHGAIVFARKGRYPLSIAEVVTAERLRSFFTREIGGYRVNRELRRHLVFAQHDLLEKPPITKLDLIISRALPTNINDDARERIFKLFRFALRPGGYLYLRDSETDSGYEVFFEAIDKCSRILKAKDLGSDTQSLWPWSVKSRGSIFKSDELGKGLSHALLQLRLVSAPACVERDTAESLNGTQSLNQHNHGFVELQNRNGVFEFEERDEAFNKQAAELREQGELLNLAYDAIIVRNLADRILFWNWGAERLYGWNAEEVLGKKSIDVWQTIFPQSEEEIRLTLLREKRWEGELSHLRRDGSRVIVASRMALQLDVRRQFKILQVNLDITRRREIENERERLMRRLVRMQEEERRRLSRELHDHFGQQITALRLGLEALNITEGESLLQADRIEELRKLVKRMDAEVSFLAWGLRPTILDDLGLKSALENLVQEWSKYTGFHAEFQAVNLIESRFPPEIETHLYRIAQEALNNISKHAQASRAGVILKQSDSQITLIVEDNGIGFDPHLELLKAKCDGGLGLIGMRERSSLIGGEMDIESSAGNGAAIFVQIPFTGLNKKGQVK